LINLEGHYAHIRRRRHRDNPCHRKNEGRNQGRTKRRKAR
jgi:hypothetical protein